MSQSPSLAWIQEEYSSNLFSDERLHERTIKLLKSFLDSPALPINQACKDWAAVKGAYRYFDNKSVTASMILDPHYESTVLRCEPSERVVVLNDTTYVDYNSHKATKGLGIYGSSKGFDNQGLITHTAFAVEESGLPLGVIHQKTYVRDRDDSRNSSNETEIYKKPIESKESYRWIETLQTVKQRLGDKNFVMVGDRENDIYEFFQEALVLDVDVIVRSCYSRIIEDESGFYKKLDEKLQEIKVTSKYDLFIPSRKGVKARTATMSLRFGEVMLISRPHGRSHLKSKSRTDVPLYVVDFKEENPAKGIKTPLHWRLLTNIEVKTEDDARKIIFFYKQRWQIETFHRILKSECKIEECRLNHADKLIKFIAMKSIIAWRIYWLTMIKRIDPNVSCECVFSKSEWHSAWITLHYEKIQEGKMDGSPPTEVPSLGVVLSWIARLGGWIGRKGDGEPGTGAISKGWRRIESGAIVWEKQNGQK